MGQGGPRVNLPATAQAISIALGCPSQLEGKTTQCQRYNTLWLQDTEKSAGTDLENSAVRLACYNSDLPAKQRCVY